MTLTLFDLTYRVARELGVVAEGLATGGDATSLIDTVNRLEADDYWNLGTVWILKDAAGEGAAPEGEYGRVTNFDHDTKDATIEALTTDIAVGDWYAIGKKRFPLSILIQKVNAALQDLKRIPLTDITTITIADSQTEYALPIAANLDLREVWRQNKLSDSDDNRWTRVYGWYVQRTAIGTADELILPGQYASGYVLKLVYMDKHPDMFDHADKLSETVSPELIIYNAALECFRWYRQKTRIDDFDADIARLSDKVRELKIQYPLDAPRRGDKIMIVGDIVGPYEDLPNKVYLR